MIPQIAGKSQLFRTSGLFLFPLKEKSPDQSAGAFCRVAD
jgi:hypothetical protein